jgi:hypothetical protein
MAKNKSEFDSPWKDILDLYFEEFIALCWPSKYDEIDWSKGYKMRDKELSKIHRTSKTGKKVADKLVEIYLKNGVTDYIKIFDYSNRIEELEASNNPFAAVILTQLAVMKKEGSSDKLNTKLHLIKNLYKKGWKKEDLLALLKFIDWTMALPPELELQCTEATEKVEEELKMKYVTSFERVGIRKGETEILVFLLNTKFQTIPEKYLDKIKNATSDSLMAWAKKLLFAPKIEDVFEEENSLATS